MKTSFSEIRGGQIHKNCAPHLEVVKMEVTGIEFLHSSNIHSIFYGNSLKCNTGAKTAYKGKNM